MRGIGTCSCQSRKIYQRNISEIRHWNPLFAENEKTSCRKGKQGGPIGAMGTSAATITALFADEISSNHREPLLSVVSPKELIVRFRAQF
jgi:hypothetical protein